MSHPVMWFEILGPESQPLRSFYGDLFGWKISDEQYGLVEKNGDAGIPGGVGEWGDVGSNVTVYIQVPDLQKALDRAVELGGEVLMPPTKLPDATLAAFRDPAGNRIGLALG